jgi:hypothetical protein
MKTPKIFVPIDQADYEVCVTAARLARKASGKSSPDTETLIAFQFKCRTAEGLAKDYLDCSDEREARLRVSGQVGRGQRKPRKRRHRRCLVKLPILRSARPERGSDLLRSTRKPADLSRN